jgi:starch synthase
MSKTKVLYVSQEITPFLPKNEISDISRSLPQGIHEKGKEIRVFMPRYGAINERRHQLHEVIRLSGMNLVINDTDHPLIIKVASIPSARMQVYFIDNEDYFQRKAVLSDKNGSHFNDNDERSIFFCRGVLETVKKLGWAPDIIHCHGWFTSLLPLYTKKLYHDDPHFADTKVIISAYNTEETGELDPALIDKLRLDGFSQEDLAPLKGSTIADLYRLALAHADAVVQGSRELTKEISDVIASSNKVTLPYCEPTNSVKACSDFYDTILQENPVLAD